MMWKLGEGQWKIHRETKSPLIIDQLRKQLQPTATFQNLNLFPIKHSIHIIFHWFRKPGQLNDSYLS